MVAVIVTAEEDCDVGSPSHRAEAMPAIRAADGVGALRCCSGTNAHAAVILPSDAAGGIAMVAVIVTAEEDCDVGSPPHRTEAMPVIRAADGVGALRCCSGTNAHAAVILPSDAARSIAVVAVIVTADAHCDVGSPPHRTEAMPAIRAADGVGALRCC